MTTGHVWTAEDYGSIPEEVICEIYDGGLYVSPSVSVGHQRAVYRLLRSFEFIFDDTLVSGDVDVRVGDKVFQPDVFVMSERFDGRPVPASNVRLIAEVVSDNENIERTTKMREYAAAGIPAYIIVDGKNGMRTAEIFRLVDGKYELAVTVPANGQQVMGEPFKYILDMGKINK
ncbi:MAG: Uma2 family endonuclease [Hamadaea sp.]|uniref:Uma2 family endonuclease n=1 Tax=Hamadaea sp. TaxID=2024425 RepID=UPI001806A926|nr:Uma2 family endonuclease [Hamadaea sp.]NUT23777.1 Uma2 family endonuclease [Hamadaea sp.]